MILKNKKLPPLTPSRIDNIIESSPIKFNDLKTKISLIEKARTSTSHEINNIISQLRDMYKSDCNAFSIVSESNSQKKSELEKYETEFKSLDEKYTKFKNTVSIVNILQDDKIQDRIERLQNSINEITDNCKSFGGIPKMEISNKDPTDLTKVLQLTDFNFKLLENYIYSLNKRTVIIDQNEGETFKVNEKYGNTKNLLNLLKDLENENQNLRDMEKRYFHDRTLRRYPLTKFSSLYTKLLADTLQHCFSQELSLLHSLGIEYNDKEGNDASVFLKDENEPNSSIIDKMNTEIVELKQQINNCSINIPEIDFKKLLLLENKIHSIDQESFSVSQKIKKMIEEKNYYAKKSYETQQKLKNLQESHNLFLFNEIKNNKIAQSLYHCTSSLGLSLILNINRSTVCDTIYQWISQKQNTKISNDPEIIEEEDHEFMTRPTSTISPSNRSLLNNNFIRYKTHENKERINEIELLADGVICEFISGLEISSQIGSQLKFNNLSPKNYGTKTYFKTKLFELSSFIAPTFDNMKKFMFQNIDIIQGIEHQMLVKEHDIKITQASLITRNNAECQTEQIKKVKKTK